MNPQLSGYYHTNYNPGSGFGGSYQEGTYFDRETGNTYEVYVDSNTGQRYYVVEYETAWYKVTTNEGGKKEYTYMYSTDAGSETVYLTPIDQDLGEDPYSYQGKMPDGKYWHGCMACHHPDGAYVPWMELGGYHELARMVFFSSLGSAAAPYINLIRFAPFANLLRGKKFPGYNPAKAPKGYIWRGKPGSQPGSKNGNWYNPKTGETLRPDLDHLPPIKRHWDYRDSNGNWWRIFEDGTMLAK